MNWEAIGAIGEIVGALAVVLSLIYLATQIRVSNRSARNAAHQEIMDQNFRAYHLVAENEELSDLWIRGMQDDESLSERKLFRFRALLTPIVLTWQRFFYLGEQGEIDESMAEGMAFVRKQVVGSPGFKSWYNERKMQLGKEFRAVLEAEMQEADPNYSPIGVKLNTAQEESKGSE